MRLYGFPHNFRTDSAQPKIEPSNKRMTHHKGKDVSLATIKENRRGGKIVSYYFTACLGRDEQGKQIRQYLTWTLPKGIGQKTARKEAEKQAALWEESLKKETEEQHVPVSLPAQAPTEHKDDFITFIEETWFPLKVAGNDRKAKTVAFYSSILKIIER